MANGDIRYRPLRAGVSIINPRVNEPGTLGVILKDSGNSLWAVSCYHVLCNGQLGPYVQDDPIYQPAAVDDDNRIGITTAAKASRDLDCAAVRIMDGVSSAMEVLGLGTLAGFADPDIDMRVVKVGAATGLTECVVSQVIGNQVLIRVNPGFPDDYVLSGPGDSGALWVEQGTNRAVALHSGLKTPKTATGNSIVEIAGFLRLTL